MSVPFMGWALSTGYSRPKGSHVYFGMNNSGIMCANPMRLVSYNFQPINSDTFNCPETDLALTFPEWNSKWYSPLCRPWFKN